jgi:hypothetical protein
MLSATAIASRETSRLPEHHWARDEFHRYDQGEPALPRRSSGKKAGDTVIRKQDPTVVRTKVEPAPQRVEARPIERVDVRHRYSGRVLRTLFSPSLAGLNLSQIDLVEADLAGQNLRCANLEGASLAGADLRRANLTGANLAGANLARAMLAGAQLRGATYDDRTIFPRDLDIEAAGAVQLTPTKRNWAWWWKGR